MTLTAKLFLSPQNFDAILVAAAVTAFVVDGVSVDDVVNVIAVVDVVDVADVPDVVDVASITIVGSLLRQVQI